MEKTTIFLMAEGFLRMLSMLLATAAAIIVGVDTETEKVMFMEKTARIKMLPAIWVFLIVASVVAAYNFVQLCRCFILGWLGKNQCKENKGFVWICLLLDQAMTYAIFTTTLAAFQGSFVAFTGVRSLQWDKLCNIYMKFCVQAAVGFVVGLVLSVVMVIISWASAYHVFRLYPRSFTREAR